MAKKESSSPGFVLVYMIPLLLYYFISYKIYMSSIDDTKGLRRKDVDPKSKIALLKLGLMVIVFLLVYSYIVKEMSKHCAIGSKNFGLNSFLYSFVPFLFVNQFVLDMFSVVDSVCDITFLGSGTFFD